MDTIEQCRKCGLVMDGDCQCKEPDGDAPVRPESSGSPINQMIDAACGYNQPQKVELTKEQKELCASLGSQVLGDLRFYYPDVVKTRPTTWPTHLRNTIAHKAESMLIEILENAKNEGLTAPERDL